MTLEASLKRAFIAVGIPGNRKWLCARLAGYGRVGVVEETVTSNSRAPWWGRFAVGSPPSLDLRERLGGKWTKRVVGKRVDRADVDLAKDVGICAIWTFLSVEKIRVP